MGDDEDDIEVCALISFHQADILLKLNYYLHIYVYDIHGIQDVPVILDNWDESEVKTLPVDREDEYLGKSLIPIQSQSEIFSIKIPLTLKLGEINRHDSFVTRKIAAFGTLVP